MVQQEKQAAMRGKAVREYGADIEVKTAEKNIFKFFTADKSITYTCHNNGVIDVSERMRRGHGAKSSDSKSDTVSETKTEPKKIAGKASKGTSNADKKPAAEALTPEHRREKAVGEKTEIQRTVSQKTLEEEVKPEEDTIEKSQKPKYHFKTGECVKDICGNRKFTVISVSPYPGAIARVRDNDTKMDCTVAVADLIPCNGKPLVLDDNTAVKS